MPSGRRWACLVIALGCLARAARADDEANWARLHSMSHERRLLLAENLKRFDSLPREEQLAIRKLQEGIAQLEPTEQVRYLAAMRRYHLWLEALPPARRDQVAQLARGPVAQRVEQVHQLQHEEASKPRRPGPSPLQAIDRGRPTPYDLAQLSGPSLYDLAQALQVWLLLSREEREKTRFAGSPQFLEKASAQLAARKKVALAGPPTREELDDIIKRHDRQQPERKKKALNAALNGLWKMERVRSNWALNEYFRRHPVAVAPEKLLQFESSFPPWVRGMLDPLPPEEARRRLRILYRLIYGTAEMPDPKPDASPKPAVAPSSSPPAPPAPPGASPRIPF